MIELLEDEKWKDTGWDSFGHMGEYTGSVQITWLNSGYKYAVVKFTIDNTTELYRQKVEECKCKSCKTKNTIVKVDVTRIPFVFLNTSTGKYTCEARVTENNQTKVINFIEA